METSVLSLMPDQRLASPELEPRTASSRVYPQKTGELMTRGKCSCSSRLWQWKVTPASKMPARSDQLLASARLDCQDKPINCTMISIYAPILSHSGICLPFH